jgi:hypothetical protein
VFFHSTVFGSEVSAASLDTSRTESIHDVVHVAKRNLLRRLAASRVNSRPKLQRG